MSDYETRAQTYGLANADQLKQALQDPDSVLVDTRNDDEIQASGKFERAGHQYMCTPGTPSECKLLSISSDELLPNKKGE
jgi:hypothetical protein